MMDEDFSSLPPKQSRDIYDFACKVINFRDLLLLIWKSVYCNKELIAREEGSGANSRKSSNSLDVDGELGFGEGNHEVNPETRRSYKEANKSKHASSFHSTTNKIFNFELEDAFLDANPIKREKRFSEEILEDLDALETPNIYQKMSVTTTAQKEKTTRSATFIDILANDRFLELDPIKNKILKDLSEVKIVLYLLAILGQALNMYYLLLFKVCSLLLYFERVFSTTYSLLMFRIKKIASLNSRVARLADKQPSKNSVLIREVSAIFNTLSFNFFDLLFGWLWFLVFYLYGGEVKSLLSDLHNLIHPNVFKKQLSMIMENPAGIKLNPTYCGIISKLTQTIFLLQ